MDVAAARDTKHRKRSLAEQIQKQKLRTQEPQTSYDHVMLLRRRSVTAVGLSLSGRHNRFYPNHYWRRFCGCTCALQCTSNRDLPPNESTRFHLRTRVRA